MKNPLFLLLLFPLLVGAQLKVEWKKDLTTSGDSEIITDIILNDDLVYTSLRGENGSSIVLYHLNGTQNSVLKENSFIQNLQMLNIQLYSMGGCQLIKRDVHGVINFETCLKLEENWTVSAVAGEIMGSAVYALHFAKMIAAYDLNGQLKWSKALGEVSQNQFLKTGGKYIYVLANISSPAQGNRLFQYDTLGNQNWSLPMGMVTNILADRDGNCYVFSVQPQTSNVVTKLNPDGETVWTKVVSGQVVLNGFLYGDSLFVCGSECIDVAPNRHQNPTFSVLSVKAGAILHQQTLDFYEGDQGYGEGFSHLVYDGKALYLGGHSGSQYVENFLVKLSREGNTTSLPDDKTSRSSFSIFPNPGGSKFTISCAEAGSGTLKVTVRNTLGHVVKSEDISCMGEKSWELDLGKQAAGSYNVEILCGTQKIVKKIVIQ